MAMVTLRQHRLSYPVAAGSGLLRDEYHVDFDRYMVLYGDVSDDAEHELDRRSPLTALMLGYSGHSQLSAACLSGEISIGCYQGDRFVGCINFYEQPTGHPPNGVDGEGLVSLWYPLACFPHILDVLRHAKHLSLSLVCQDLAGDSIVPPMGTLLTWPEPAGE